MKVFIVTNISKPKVKPAFDELLPWISARAEVTGVETDKRMDLEKVEADVFVVFGGDGTLLSAARRLNGRQTPVMGVNFGRLGFLASFTPEDFKDHFEALLRDELPIGTRLMLEASVVDCDKPCNLVKDADVRKHRRWSSVALNDAVISAGSPFRMIELVLGTDTDPGVRYFGDGMIVATPSGSTAYNVSAGGPILNVNVEGICITPLCPHSLSFRPIVISPESRIIVSVTRANWGTTLFCDGQASEPLKAGDRVVIRRADHGVVLVENPDAREWRTLAEKLQWASSPRYTDQARFSTVVNDKPGDFPTEG